MYVHFTVLYDMMTDCRHNRGVRKIMEKLLFKALSVLLFLISWDVGKYH